jgi:hypothetical protein
MDTGFLFAPGAMADPAFDHKLDMNIRASGHIIAQDLHVDELVQQGLRSRFAPRGRYSWQEARRASSTSGWSIAMPPPMPGFLLRRLRRGRSGDGGLICPQGRALRRIARPGQWRKLGKAGIEQSASSGSLNPGQHSLRFTTNAYPREQRQDAWRFCLAPRFPRSSGDQRRPLWRAGELHQRAGHPVRAADGQPWPSTWRRKRPVSGWCSCSKAG